MENILKYLPKAATSFISFQNPPSISPAHDKRLEQAFSIPMIPSEVRRKTTDFETQEPTSPKVSCMGQIKKKNSLCKKKCGSRPVSNIRAIKPKKIKPTGPKQDPKKKPSGFSKLFVVRRKYVVPIDQAKPSVADRTPSLSHLMRHSSSRERFANFDWKNVQVALVGDGEDYSFDDDRFIEEDDDVVLSFSRPVLVTEDGAGLDLKPRKEINLWKRRTMAQPKPLKLNIA